MKKIALAIVMALLLTVTTGCGRTLIGKWKAVNISPQIIYVFNEDETCSYEAFGIKVNCTYKNEDNKITVLFEGKEEPKTYEYRIEENTLIIKEDSGIEVRYK